MPKTKLGKVSLSPKGAWDASAAYEQLDMVSYDGGSWLAKKPSTNITPADGEYWMEVAEKGSDAAVTEENIVSALGFEPEKKRRFELIESITLTEDTTSILRTAEPDGTPYKFTDVWVDMVLEPTDTSVTTIVRLNAYTATGGIVGGLYNWTLSKYKYSKTRISSDCGFAYIMSSLTEGLNNYNGLYYAAAPKYMGLDLFSDPIGKLYIFATTGGTTANTSMKAGGTIQIYAIRA